MIRRLKYWILGVVIAGLKVGAHCGLCGKWIERELVDRAWPYSICDECAEPEKTNWFIANPDWRYKVEKNDG